MSDIAFAVVLHKLLKNLGRVLFVLFFRGSLKADLEAKVAECSLVLQFCAFMTRLLFPPRAQRSPPGHPQKRTIALLKSINILVILGHPFLVDS